MPARKQTVTREVDGVTVATFKSRAVLDAGQVRDLGDDLYDLIDVEKAGKIVIDFSTVTALSSAALGVLITLRKKAEAQKAKVVLCGIQDDLRKLFKMTKLDRVFEIHKNEAEALDAFGVNRAT